MPQDQLPNSTWLFEASWEVCNKAGGIHTVIVSKIREARSAFPNCYLPIGPYFPGDQPVFREVALPAPLQGVADSIAKEGITAHYGYWLINPETPVLLLDWQGLLPRLNEFKSLFWERYQVDTLGTGYFDVDEPLLWSTAVGLFAKHFAEINKLPILLHAHEWLSAGALLTVSLNPHPDIRTIFTAHATVLGRALSGQGRYSGHSEPDLKADDEAKKAGVLAKHLLEKNAARLATVFTTVSHTTALEAKAFLGVEPHIVVENGLESSTFPTFDQISRKREMVQERLADFVAAYFFPTYRFSLKNVRYQFTMGRYEVRNKGYDLYLESLGELNKLLQKDPESGTVIAFFLVPKENTTLRPEVATGLSIYREALHAMHQALTRNERELIGSLWDHGSEAFEAMVASVDTAVSPLLSRTPEIHPDYSPFVVHDSQDAIIQQARQHGLLNRPEDKVKLVYFPVFVDALDGIFNLSLYDLISGFDLGVFPSIYEPWGYTPMESLAMGVPAITTTTAGFGQSVAGQPEFEKAVFLVNRGENEWKSEVQQLASLLYQSVQEDSRTWLSRRIAAYNAVQHFDWQNLYPKYLQAYLQAYQANS